MPRIFSDNFCVKTATLKDGVSSFIIDLSQIKLKILEQFIVSAAGVGFPGTGFWGCIIEHGPYG